MNRTFPQILHLARQAGTTRAQLICCFRLNDNVQPVFLERKAAAFPDRIRKFTNRFVRRGEGARWKKSLPLAL